MPSFGVLPQTATLVALATTTTTGTTAALTLPPAASYRIVVQVQTVSGTSPTLQVIICTSMDAGTTYNEILSFANLTTTGQGRQMLIRPYLGLGDAATTAASAFLNTTTPTDLASGDLVNNGPINPQFIKIRWVHTGTSPSFAWQIQYIALPQDLSD